MGLHQQTLKLSQHRMLGNIGIMVVRLSALRTRVRGTACFHTSDVCRALDVAQSAISHLCDTIREAQEESCSK